jgi:hypothetical protein
MEIIFGIRKLFGWFTVWGVICFILGYGLHGKIWWLINGILTGNWASE